LAEGQATWEMSVTPEGAESVVVVPRFEAVVRIAAV
jgi:hypothetical protein